MKRKTVSLQRSLDFAESWRFLGEAETSYGGVEVYDVDGTELRYGTDKALAEYHVFRSQQRKDKR